MSLLHHAVPSSPAPPTPNSPSVFSFSNEAVQQYHQFGKLQNSESFDTNLEMNECEESRMELVEACMDFLACNTFGMASTVPLKSALSEFLLDRSRSETWLLGHKLITVTTSDCDSRSSAFGLCDNCEKLCKSLDNPALCQSTEVTQRVHKVTPLNPNIHTNGKVHGVQPSDSNELQKLVSSRRRHQSDIQPSLVHRPSSTLSTNALDDYFGPQETRQSKPSSSNTCNCWCQGWAEILIRRPTGNTSWIIRLQNPLGAYSSSPPEDFSDLTALVHAQMLMRPNKQAPPENPENYFIPIDSDNESIINQEVVTICEGASKSPGTRPTTFRACSSPEVEHNNGATPINSAKGSSDSINGVTSLNGDIKENCNITNGFSPIEPPQTQNPKRVNSVARAASFGGSKFNRAFSPNPRSEFNRQLSGPGSGKVKLRLNLDNGNSGDVGSLASAFANHHSMSQNKIRSPPRTPAPRINEAENFPSGYRERVHTISVMSPAQEGWKKTQASSSRSSDNLSRVKTSNNGVCPRYVFLQYYYNSVFEERFHDDMIKESERGKSYKRWKGEREKRVPILLPKTEEFNRALRCLDRITPYETHKVGVLYVGPGQANDKTAILSNQHGSSRYIAFLKGLGSFIRLKDVDLLMNYVGGLDTQGNDGQYALSWKDSLAQVIFHVATLMPTKAKDPNCNEKKRHIGNDSVCIVYNDSGEEVSLSTIKVINYFAFSF